MARIFMNQSLTEISRSTTDKYQDKTWTVLYQFVPCRFSYETGRERLEAEERLTVTAVCYLEPKYIIQEDDRVVYIGEYYLVHRVIPVPDLFGKIDHLKILLKSR